MGVQKSSASEALSEKEKIWFRDAGLGMFIHWGLYSILGHGEWAQWREDIHPREYNKLISRLTAKNFDAGRWARLAKRGGAKYVVFTARHHDGFCLWDSKLCDRTSVHSPANRDFLGEYVKAARDCGLKVGLYFSGLDWSWPAYNMKLPEKAPLAWQRFVEQGPRYDANAWNDFVEYVHAQVRELMSSYGRIDLLWYDGFWHQSASEWKSKELNDMVRQIQPRIVINDRSGTPEDYDTPENEIPLNIQPKQRPWEVCFCMNDTWGYIPGDKNYKTARQCLYALIRVRSAGGNLLLNTSPKADGSMPAPCIRVFEDIGEWLGNNGRSIYGAGLAEMSQHGTGFYAQPGMLTAKPQSNTLFYHILRYMGKDQHCVKVDAKVNKAILLKNKRKVEFVQNDRMIYFKNLPPKAPDPYDTVIELQYEPGTAKSVWTKTFV